jgi:hypothetical protein
VVDVRIRVLVWAGNVIGMEDKENQKMFLMGNIITKEQWGNQEEDGRTSSGGTHHRSYEDEEDKHKT